MASQDRPAPSPVAVLQRVLNPTHSFDFFAAVREIECAWTVRLGTSVQAADEPVVLGQRPSLAFAPTVLVHDDVTEQVSGEKPRLRTYFFGLFGPQGPLPLHLTEVASRAAANGGENPLAAFADVFHHRMLSLLYRAWANPRLTTNFDIPTSDRFRTYIAALGGIAGGHEFHDSDAHRYSRLYLSGVLASGTRSRESLERLLQLSVDAPVKIAECEGGWLPIATKDKAGLRCRRRLGSCLLGRRSWSAQHIFKVIVGPLPVEAARKLLPGCDEEQRLHSMIRSHVGLEYDWRLQVLIDDAHQNATRIGRYSRLRRMTWLKPRQSDEHVTVAVRRGRSSRAEPSRQATMSFTDESSVTGLHGRSNRKSDGN